MFRPDIVKVALQQVFSVMIPAFIIESGNVFARRRKIEHTSTESAWIDGPLQEAAMLVSSTVALGRVLERYLLDRIAGKASIENWMSYYFVCLLAFHIIPFQVGHESLR